jgi:hypothetical protein
MSRRALASAILSLVLPVGGAAQSIPNTAAPPTHLTRQELSNLLKTAHSSAEYRQLAAYYREREADYRAKAAAEKIERDRRAQVNAALYQKYPRPVDSAQYLYESYLVDADQAAAKAQHYEQLAARSTL